MTDSLYDTILKNKEEYPKADKNKDFIQELNRVAEYQKDNPTQQQKESFYNKTTDGKKLQALVLKNQMFTHCNFDSSTIIRCLFQKCIFTDCSFSGCTLYNVKFIDCSLTDCNFTSTNMQDVDASTSTKKNCKFGDIDTSNNVVGFDEKDKNIITDQTQEQNVITAANVIQNCMKQYFPDWELIDDQISYKKEFPNEANAGIALYKNQQKNTASENQDYWEISLYIGQNTVLTSDFNLFGKSEKDIKSIIQNWINEVLVDNANEIVKNMIDLLMEK